MSVTDRLPAIVVEGPRGVEIQVVDGYYDVVARGTERLETQLKPGIYTVRWVVGSRRIQEVVRLPPDRVDPLVVLPPSTLRPDQLRSLSGHEGLSPARLAAPQDWQGAKSEIAILATGGFGKGVESLGRGLRLYDDENVGMRSDEGAVQDSRDQAEAKGGWALRVYKLRRIGVYRLRFNASSGLKLDQSVVALPGRRTIVMLQAASGIRLVESEDRFAEQGVTGADVGRSVIISVPMGAPGEQVAANARIGETLLSAISRGGDPLNATLLRRLEEPNADPLLRLYAAVLIVDSLEAGHSPAFDDDPPEESGELSAEFKRRWRKRSRALLAAFPCLHVADVVATRWKLQPKGKPVDPGKLQSPPMLSVCWPWAVDFSSHHAARTLDTPSLRGATFGRVMSPRFLGWNVGSAKAGLVVDDQPGRGRSALQRSLTRIAKQVGETTSNKDSALMASGSVLSSFALATLRTLNDKGLLSRAIVPRDLPALARSLGVPLKLLSPTLQQTAVEMESIASTETPRRASRISELNKPDALRRPILHPDDPQKGRFGGLAEVDGFKLTAKFKENDEDDWVRVVLTVRASDDRNQAPWEVACFYLHDTFKPNRYVEKFLNSAASLRLWAFGGFTVGVWLPTRDTELELDLATIDGAPRVIREW